jgi:hypothetical protein
MVCEIVLFDFSKPSIHLYIHNEQSINTNIESVVA